MACRQDNLYTNRSDFQSGFLFKLLFCKGNNIFMSKDLQVNS